MKLATATRAQAKARARMIRAASQEAITHAQALERAAAELGYHDWNTASARLPERQETAWRVGDRVGGYYLKQPFEGAIHAVLGDQNSGGHHLTLQFDQAVDVVEWDSFSAYRRRVTSKITDQGVSNLKTSDGAPHLLLYRLPSARLEPGET